MEYFNRCQQISKCKNYNKYCDYCNRGRELIDYFEEKDINLDINFKRFTTTCKHIGELPKNPRRE